MEYFTFFPKTIFNDKSITDITIRLDFLNKIKNNIYLYEFIQVRDDQKPEDVALQYYSDPSLYWIVLFANEIIDPYHDWVMSEERLHEFAKRIYGTNALQDIHHYESTEDHDLGKGEWVNSTDINAVPVSNLTYEQTLNEEKRKIKLIKNQYISQIVAEYKNRLDEIDNDL